MNIGVWIGSAVNPQMGGGYSYIAKLIYEIDNHSFPNDICINFLASDELQGREAGFHGSRVTSEYIVSLLQWMGVSSLADSYFQPFDAYRTCFL